jgi:hypothetical protein
MGIYTHGWIEVADVVGIGMESKWVGVIKVTPFVFPGLAKGELRYRLYDQAEHGFPSDLSEEVKCDKIQYPMSPASILWSKIEQELVDLWDTNGNDRWWWELSDMVAILRHDHKAEHIRFVFWGG